MSSEPAAKDKVLVFLPTYNDHTELLRIIREIESQGPEYRILVIDDGSTQVVEPGSLPDHVLQVRLPDNFGLGVCTHVAFDHAVRHGYRAVIRIDADGQHPVDRIPNLRRALDEGSVDLCIGARTNRNDGNDGNGFRALVSRLIRQYLSVVARMATAGKSPADINSGFMGVSLKAAKQLSRFSLERYPEPQIVVLALRNGLRVGTVPIEQAPRAVGTSTIGLSDGAALFYRFNMFIIGEFLQGRNHK